MAVWPVLYKLKSYAHIMTVIIIISFVLVALRGLAQLLGSAEHNELLRR